MNRYLLAVATALAALLAFAGVGHAQNKPKAYIGALSCNVSGSTGFIFGSTKELSCVFLTATGRTEYYSGAIHKFGIDIGYTKAVHMVWHVYTLGSDRGPGALAGQFGGTQGQVALGSGVGGNLLYGGHDNEIVLQSAGAEGNAGYNVADGIAEMSLRPR